MSTRELTKTERRIAEKALREAIEKVGGPKAVGDLFVPVISGQAVSQWDICPLNRVRRLAEESEVALSRLAPDLYPKEKPLSEARVARAALA